MIILGLNAYHGDSSAVLLGDGAAALGAENERFSRLKHHAGFPAQAAAWCLQTADHDPKDLGHIAISRDPSTHLYSKVLFAAPRALSNFKMFKQRAANAAKVWDAKGAVAVSLDADPSDIQAKFHNVEHHRAHLASAFFCSPFDDAALLSIDGMGDFVSTMWANGRDRRIDVNGYVTYPHSLGFYYTAFTQFLGMPSYGDEYKLMGLSAYGQPRYMEQVRDVLRLGKGLRFELNLDYFLHDSQGIDMTWESGVPEIGRMWSDKMLEVFGPPREYRGDVSERDADLAASVQKHLEDVVLEMLRRLHARTNTPRLCLAGGVALNCVVNGMIREHTPFEEVWIQPAANDAGTAIGAALWVKHQVLGRPRDWVMDHVYMGPSFDETAYKKALSDAELDYRELGEEELCDYTARRISEGAVVGWFHGAMEFGPRALGNRSIVCDPRRHDMKDILNSRIKYREHFRPFAPSILEDKTSEWFEEGYPSPFMLMAYKVRPEKRDQIPAVTHEDGTGRLQTVSRNINARYYDLIAAFDRLTGVPLVLNTSFNENEPICATPEEAIDTFQRTKMDLLVLGNFIAEKAPRP